MPSLDSQHLGWMAQLDVDICAASAADTPSRIAALTRLGSQGHAWLALHDHWRDREAEWRQALVAGLYDDDPWVRLAALKALDTALCGHNIPHDMPYVSTFYKAFEHALDHGLTFGDQTATAMALSLATRDSLNPAAAAQFDDRHATELLVALCQIFVRIGTPEAAAALSACNLRIGWESTLSAVLDFPVPEARDDILRAYLLSNYESEYCPLGTLLEKRADPFLSADCYAYELAHGNLAEQLAAIAALRQFGLAGNARAWSIFLRTLSPPTDPLLMTFAATTFFYDTGLTEGDEVTSRLQPHLKSPDPYLRLAITRVLRYAMGPSLDQARLALLNDPVPEIRHAAAASLLECCADCALLIDPARTHPDPEVRRCLMMQT